MNQKTFASKFFQALKGKSSTPKLPTSIFHEGEKYDLSVTGREKIVYINDQKALKIYRSYLGITQEEAHQYFLNLKLAQTLFPAFFLKHYAFYPNMQNIVTSSNFNEEMKSTPAFLAERIHLPEGYLSEIRDHYKPALIQFRTINYFPPVSLYMTLLDKIQEFGIYPCEAPHNVFYDRENNRLIFFEIKEFNIKQFLNRIKRDLTPDQRRTFANLKSHWTTTESIVNSLEGFRKETPEFLDELTRIAI